MKRHIGIGTVLLLSVLELSGCDSNDKKILVGKWETKKGIKAAFYKDNTAVHANKNISMKLSI